MSDLSNNTIKTDLTVVIPTYKGRFLDSTLRSLASQTDKDFHVIVGDDASPDDITGIISRWNHELTIHHHRFNENLGGSDLAAHWNRCVALTQSTWVWLLGDDDEAETRCVEVWRSTASRLTQPKLLRFNVLKIDALSLVTEELKEYPANISGIDFLIARLEGRLSSFAPEYIFHRETWDKRGRFISFPLAWCSDDATWLRLSLNDEINTLVGAKVRWRHSGVNLSSMNNKLAARKAQAATLFIGWIKRMIAAGELNAQQSTVRLLEIRCFDWLFSQFQSQATGYTRFIAACASFATAKGWRSIWLLQIARRCYWRISRTILNR